MKDTLKNDISLSYDNTNIVPPLLKQHRADILPVTDSFGVSLSLRKTTYLVWNVVVCVNGD